MLGKREGIAEVPFQPVIQEDARRAGRLVDKPDSIGAGLRREAGGAHP